MPPFSFNLGNKNVSIWVSLSRFFNTTLIGSITAIVLGAFASRSVLILFSNQLIDIIFSFPLLVTPTLSTKLLIASGVYPLLLRPSIVGILGSISAASRSQ